MSKRSLALLGATFVALIYGANFTIAKDVMPTYVQPYFGHLPFLVLKKKLHYKTFLELLQRLYLVLSSINCHFLKD